MNPVLKRAIEVASTAHEGQYRKVSGAPYIVHPFSVMLLLQYVGEGAEALCAAVLHDVLEDTDYTKEQMLAEFGDTITNAVSVVTKDPAIKDKRAQCEDYLLRLEHSESLIALAVAAADKCSNISDTIDQGRPLTKHEDWWYQAVLDLLKRLIPEYSLTKQLEIFLEQARVNK